MSESRMESTLRLRLAIRCLCASTRFVDAFSEANRREAMAGRIVLAPGVFGWAGDCVLGEAKVALDELHLRKIDLANEVLIVTDGFWVITGRWAARRSS